ncbi:hypothetical protein [Brevibacillus antibioticus]|uniref:hypothetical protein n=1 Tax=Brevibacillus antibioticus TaxID=2570228 RepID=UPI00139037FF|nr:hypothetical protein [Brevibacillus antibioticus]
MKKFFTIAFAAFLVMSVPASYASAWNPCYPLKECTGGKPECKKVPGGQDICPW